MGPAAIELAPVPFDTNKTLGTADFAYNLGQLAFSVPNFNWTIYSGNTLWNSLSLTTQNTRDPTSADNTWPIGATWSNTASNAFFALTSYPSAGMAQWEPLTTSSGPGTLSQITAEDLNVVLPDGIGNINIIGGTSGFLTTTRSATNTLTVKENGVLATIYGGTGAGTFTANGILIAQGASTFQATSAGSVGQPLLSGGLGVNPNWGTLGVSYGGTGDTSFTAYAVICGGTTSTGALQNVVGLGTLGEVLTSQGPGTLPVWAVNPAKQVNIQIFTSTGTYTPTAGMTYCIIEALGGGAGGASAVAAGSTLISGGSGGGMGAYVKALYTAATIGTSQVVTIGAGGGSDADGGTTTVGTLVTANGGIKGNTTVAAQSIFALGGGGGTGSASSSVASVSFTGNAGGVAMGTAGIGGPYVITGGAGAPSVFGGSQTAVGTNTAATRTNGLSATSYGAGGGGGIVVSDNSGLGATGGSGFKGIVIITEFF